MFCDRGSDPRMRKLQQRRPASRQNRADSRLIFQLSEFAPKSPSPSPAGEDFSSSSKLSSSAVQTRREPPPTIASRCISNRSVMRFMVMHIKRARRIRSGVGQPRTSFLQKQFSGLINSTKLIKSTQL